MEKSLDYTSRVDKSKANEYLQLCKDAEDALYYHKRHNGGEFKASNGYISINSTHANGYFESNFKGVLYQKDDQYVIYYFGTDIKSPKDLYTDLMMGLHRVPKQFKAAEKFAYKMIDLYNINPQNLTVIGHSEGGSEALYVKAAIPGIQAAYTFNPFIPTIRNAEEANLQNIYNFRAPADPISKIGETLGEDFIVDCKYENVRKGPMNRVDQHRLDSFGDCGNAVSPADFKKQNPKFKNKFRTEQLSAEDISSIPEEYYEFVEDDIMASIQNFGTSETNTQEHTNCPGSYPVSGYTRDDGTKVASYIRTCKVHKYQ